MNYLAQIIGIFALLTWIFSIQLNQKHNVLKMQVIANILYGLQYILLGVFTAGGLNFLSAIRCFWYSKKQDETPSLFSLCFFLFLIIVVGVITFRGILSLIPVVITMLYAYISWQKNLTVFRIIFIGCAVSWLFYNITVGAYVSFVGNIIEIISGSISIIRFDILKNKYQRNDKCI